MPATIHIERYTGPTGSPVLTNITGSNTVANAVDLHQSNVVTSTDPIQIPATGGPNYSFWVTTRLRAVTAPAGAITNVRWYTDGTNNFGTGVTCKAAVSSVYGTAVGTVGVTGIALSASSIAGTLTGLQNAFLYTSLNSLSVSVSSFSSTGAFGNFVVYQTEVATNAQAGPTLAETFTFTYDET